MALHLITGRANAGKSGLINARLTAALEQGEPPVLLLPSMADVRRASAEVAAKFPLGVRVTTWNAWLDEQWRLHGDGRRLVDRAMRGALVSRAIGEVASGGLEPVAGANGLNTLIGRVIEASPYPAPEAHAEGHAGDVLEVFSRYTCLADGAGLIERAQAARLLAQRPPKALAPLVLHRFDVLSDAQVELVLAFSRSTEVTVALTWEKGFPATSALDPVIERLGGVAKIWQIAKEVIRDDEIGSLTGEIYSADAGVQAEGAVQFALAGGTEAEAELVAEAVQEALVRGIDGDHVVVAFPTLGPIAHRLRTSFASRGIEHEFDMVRPLKGSALGASFSALVDLALGIGDRTTALALLLGPHGDLPTDRVDWMDRQWRGQRVSDSRRLVKDITGAEGSETGRALDCLNRFGRVLTVSSAQLLVRAIDHLIAARMAKHPATSPRSAGLDEDAAVSATLQRAISDMVSTQGFLLTLKDVRRAFDSLGVGGTAGERAGFVQITEINRLGARRFDTVILGGLTAAEWPIGESESLFDEFTAALGVPAGVDREALARLRFYLAISRARSTLVFVRKEESSDGAPMRPSVLWEEVLDAYRIPDEELDAWPAGAPEAIRLRSSEVESIAPAFTRGRRDARREAAKSSCLSPSAPRGTLTDDDVLASLAAQTTYTASEIEAYLQCPYRWFFERVVRPSEIDREIDARAVGSLAHDLLRRFYELWDEAGIGERVEPGVMKDARQIFAEASKDAGATLRARGVADDLAVARAIRWAAGIIEDDAEILPGFVPFKHEFSFGGEGDEVMLGGVNFRGRIDRVDMSDSSIFITDYKSSRQVPGLADFIKEGRVQAVLYAEAVRQQLVALPIAGSVYRSLRTHAMRGFWRTDLIGGMLRGGDEADSIGADGYAALVAETEDRVAAAVEAIRSGRIERRPSTKAACSFCQISAQCGGGPR